MQDHTPEEIELFIKMNRHLNRKELDKRLKQTFGVNLMYRRYAPHTGDKQRIKYLMKQGLTREEAIERLINQ